MIIHRVRLGLTPRAGALTMADRTLAGASAMVLGHVPVDHTAETKADAVVMQAVAHKSTIVKVPARSITMTRSPTDV